jgi:phosphohistidine phosphatase
MDLILWRHAEAEQGGPDAERKLTEKGREQAKKLAAWLKPRLKAYQLLSSPAERAKETTTFLDSRFGILRELYSNASPAELLEAVGWPKEEGTVILVGHQPQLGEVAAFLMTRSVAPWSIKKGAIWWFKTGDEGGKIVTELTAVIAPKLA